MGFSSGGLGNRFQGSVLDSWAISIEFGPNLHAPPFMVSKKKLITVSGYEKDEQQSRTSFSVKGRGATDSVEPNREAFRAGA